MRGIVKQRALSGIGWIGVLTGMPRTLTFSLGDILNVCIKDAEVFDDRVEMGMERKE
jgi:hypothetical protein